jgi:hypothetical protein
MLWLARDAGYGDSLRREELVDVCLTRLGHDASLI